jgi:urate oxidase
MIKDFTFIIGNDRYQCAWFIADFLSPKMSRFHAVDPSIEEIAIETKITSDGFNKFISSCFTSFCEMSDDERQLFLSIRYE